MEYISIQSFLVGVVVGMFLTAVIVKVAQYKNTKG